MVRAAISGLISEPQGTSCHFYRQAKGAARDGSLGLLLRRPHLELQEGGPGFENEWGKSSVRRPRREGRGQEWEGGEEMEEGVRRGEGVTSKICPLA